MARDRETCRRQTRAGRPILGNVRASSGRRVAGPRRRPHRLPRAERRQRHSKRAFAGRARTQSAADSHRRLPGALGRRRAAQACGNEVACSRGPRPALEQRRARAGVVKLRTLDELIREYLARRAGAGRRQDPQDRARSSRWRAEAGARRSAALGPGADRLRQGGRGLRRSTEAGRSVERDQRQQASGRRQAHVQDGAGLGPHRRQLTRQRASPGPPRKRRRDRILFDGRCWSDRTHRSMSSAGSSAHLTADPSPSRSAADSRCASA